MWRYLKRFLIGRPLKTTEEGGQALSKFKALALLSSDALSSVAYGTGQITAVLITVSAAALMYQIWVAILVLILLFAVTLSYQQIIHAYPSGGGAYLVATNNWGTNVGLVAGGSLLVDYMLTVAVSVTAGTDAIVSAAPSFAHYQVFLSAMIVILIMGLNLRGLRDSASFLTFPVYLFISMIILMIGIGFYNIMTGKIYYHAAASINSSVSGMTILIFLRAFSSGSSSLTGVEAISNAVPNFHHPKSHNAATTLGIMAIILGCFFAGITFLSYYLGIRPMADNTVLSQIGIVVFGHGILYYILQLATAAILAIAANTGFSAFPILAYNLAKDKFLPHAYLDRGDRLGYSHGIISLALGAIILIIIFQGQTSRLIPLYAIGVFVPFTLSQSGMIRHWVRQRGRIWELKAIINFFGAFISITLVVILFSLRFADVWPYLIVMPALIYLFYRIHAHYTNVARQLWVSDDVTHTIDHRYDGATVVVLVSNVTKVTTNAISYARSVGDYVIAMHISFDENPTKEHETAQKFKAKFSDVRFVDIHSSYRSIITPTIRFCDVIAKRAAERNFTTTVLVPQFVPRHPWQNVLHNQTALRLRSALNTRENIIVSTYSYHLKR